jgi:hypothetical protein
MNDCLYKQIQSSNGAGRRTLKGFHSLIWVMTFGPSSFLFYQNFWDLIFARCLLFLSFWGICHPSSKKPFLGVKQKGKDTYLRWDSGQQLEGGPIVQSLMLCPDPFDFVKEFPLVFLELVGLLVHCCQTKPTSSSYLRPLQWAPQLICP